MTNTAGMLSDIDELLAGNHQVVTLLQLTISTAEQVGATDHVSKLAELKAEAISERDQLVQMKSSLLNETMTVVEANHQMTRLIIDASASVIELHHLLKSTKEKQ